MDTLARWLMRLFLGALILASVAAAGLAAAWGWVVVTSPREKFHDQGGMFITFGVAFFVVISGGLAAGWLIWAVLRACLAGRGKGR